MQDLQAVLFDFDDTLQDREAAYRSYCSAFLDECFPGLTPEEKARRIDAAECNCLGQECLINWLTEICNKP